MNPDRIHSTTSRLSRRRRPNVSEGIAMYHYLIENDLAQRQRREVEAQAQASSRARRLYLARRAARRAERAVRRAARASAAV
jgi:hypothetical protein